MEKGGGRDGQNKIKENKMGTNQIDLQTERIEWEEARKGGCVCVRERQNKKN